MKVSMSEIKKGNPLSIEELMDIPYKELLKLVKKKDVDDVTKKRAWKVIKLMRNSFFAGMKKARLECSKSELQMSVASMYPNIPIKKEVTE